MKNKKLSTACKLFSAMAFTGLVLENSFLHSIPVYANDDYSDEWALFYSTATATSEFIGLKDYVVSNYTSLDPVELKCIEYELAAFSAAGSYISAQDWALENGVSLSQTFNGSYLLAGLCIYDSGGIRLVSDGSIMAGSGGIFFNGGGYSVAVVPVVANGADPVILTSFTNDASSFMFRMYNGGDFQAGISLNGIDARSGVGTFLGGRYLRVTFGGYNSISTSWDNLAWANSVYVNWYSSGGSDYFYYGANTNWDTRYYLFGCAEPFQFDSDISNSFDLYNSVRDYCQSTYPEAFEAAWVDFDYSPPVEVDGNINDLILPPGIPTPQFNAPEIPSEPLPQKMLEGAGFWFTQFSNLLDGLGVTWIVIIFMVVALLMAILRL